MGLLSQPSRVPRSLPRTTWVPHYDKLQLIRKLLSFDYTEPQQRTYLDSMTVEQCCQQLEFSDALAYELCQCFLEMACFDTVAH